MRVYPIMCLLILCVARLAVAQDTARPEPLKAPADFAAAKATAEWLVAYDKVLWATTEKAMTNRDSIEILNPEAFCVWAADGWHAAFGVLSDDGATYTLRYHYRLPHAGGRIERLAGQFVSSHDAAMARALRAAHVAVVAPARRDPGVELRAYARPVADGIEVWVLGDRQTDGQLAYGQSHRLLYSADGRKEVSRETAGMAMTETALSAETDLRLGDETQPTPTVADLFVAIRYGRDFASVVIDSRDFVSQRLMVKGEPVWIHVRRRQ